MLYKIRVILNTDEEKNVFRDIQIRGNQTLWNLHQGIRSAFNFKTEEMASFYYCDETWEQQGEIPLEDMTDDHSGETMSDIYIKQALPELNSRLLYVYDFMDMWSFYIEAIEIKEKAPASIHYPLTIFRFGTVPLKSPKADFKSNPIKDEFHNELGEDIDYEVDEDISTLDPDLDIDDVSDFDGDSF
ncbi:MAG: hypothetical protein H6604_06670 [Flavobacteriales bacterium]|nr:hypothetical protein [Flavobacteriales bacterium]